MRDSWLASFFERKNRRPARRSRRSTCLKLELLESRFAPAVYLVQTLADNTDPVDLGHAGDLNDPFLAPSLRSALNAANASAEDDTILFDASLSGTITLGLGQLDISDDVTITGLGVGSLAVSGNNQSRVFNVDDGNASATITVVIDGLTVTGGKADDGNPSERTPDDMGGGIFNRENLTVQNSTISGNSSAARGGGVYNRGTLSVQNSTISGNTSELGGGVYSRGTDSSNRDASVSVQNSFLTGNSATREGGGLYNRYGTATVQNTTVSGNTAPFDAGGLYNRYGTMRVEDSTVSGNTSGGEGGGVFNFRGTLTLENSTVSGNSATAADSLGGGVYNRGGTATIQNSTVSGNSAGGRGGGVHTQDGGSLTLQSSAISGNSSYFHGGGVSIDGGGVEVLDSTISGNTARLDGAGLYNRNGTVTVVNTTISANSAGDEAAGIGNLGSGTLTVRSSTISGNTAFDDGGGVYIGGGTATILNSTLSGNSAGAKGGGVLVRSTSVTVHNSTITGNSAASGGGLYVWASNTATLTNSLIAGNTATSGREIFNDGDVVANAFNLFGHSGSTNAQTFAGGGVFATGINDITATLDGTQPTGLASILVPLKDNGGPTFTHALQPGSPALDAGDPAFTSAGPDQRGAPFARVVDGGSGTATVDIGAVERQSVTLPSGFQVDTLEDENDGDYSDGDRSLREMIGLANGSGGADTITFATGLTGTITLTLGQLNIRDDVTITGPGASQLAVSGNNTSRVFNVNDGTTATITVVIDGLTITGGKADDGNPGVFTDGDDGGGISNKEFLTLQNSTLTGNTAVRFGGGLFNDQGTVTLQHSTISGNFASFGGGLANVSGSLTVQNSTISNRAKSPPGCPFRLPVRAALPGRYRHQRSQVGPLCNGNHQGRQPLTTVNYHRYFV